MFGSRGYYDNGPDRRARYERRLGRASGAGMLLRAVNFVFAIIYAIVGLRIVLEILGAREGNRFKEFIDQLSAPLLVLFENLLPSIRVDRFELPLSYLFALVIYALIHYGIRRVAAAALYR
jgi:uncharacterized protein YggT (Ycf19 family)